MEFKKKKIPRNLAIFCKHAILGVCSVYLLNMTNMFMIFPFLYFKLSEERFNLYFPGEVSIPYFQVLNSPDIASKYLRLK